METPVVHLASITRLARQVGRTRHYARLWDRYLDALAACPEFHDLGEPIDDRNFEVAMRRAASRVLRAKSTPIRMTGLRLREIQEAGLRHGVCFFEGHLCLILADMQTRQGLLALRSLSADEVRYGRFAFTARAWGAAA